MKIIILLLFATGILNSTEVLEKKILIKNFETDKAVSKEIETRINNGIFLEIQNLDKSYSFINENSLNSLLKLANLNQKIGQNGFLVDKIGKSLELDGIISGKITSSDTNILISIEQLRKVESNTHFKIVDSFIVKCLPFQVEYFIKEISKKIIDPKYSINSKSAPKFSEPKLIISEIKFSKIENLNLKLYEFKTDEVDLISLIDGIQTYTKKGDEFYKEGKYYQAVEIYQNILESTRNLSEDSKLRINELILEIQKRTNYSFINIYKEKIELIDKEVNSRNSITVIEFKDFFNSYKNEFENYNKIPEYSKSKFILEVLNERISSMKLSELALIEKRGDEFYQLLNFNEAEKSYIEILDQIEKYLDKTKEGKLENRINSKIELNKKSALSFLESNLKIYSSYAESENSRFILELSMKNEKEANIHRENAVKTLELLKNTLISSIHLDENLISKFNNIADRINNSSNKINISTKNILLVPFRYIANLGKGFTDIFVLKFGYGFGLGVQGLILGVDGGYAEYPIDVSTAYTDSKSKLAVNGVGDKLSLFKKEHPEKNFITGGIFYFGESNCLTGMGLRGCFSNDKIDGIHKYSTFNFWLGVIPAINITLELHRVPELLGIAIGQDWDILNTKVKRFKYFDFEKVSLIPLVRNPIWSNYLGKLNFKEAEQYCNQKKMRLPSREEFITAYQSRVHRNLISDEIFWTNEKSKDGNHQIYVFKHNKDKLLDNTTKSKMERLSTICIQTFQEELGIYTHNSKKAEISF
jgi:tetratricopeptide (TPR) repeat protein